MRVACWLFVVCAVVASIAMFVPAVQVEVGGAAISHRAAESVYQIDTSKGFARRVLARYRASRGAHVGKQIVTHAMPHAGKTLRGHLDDVASAMSTLDDVSDDDVKTVGTILTVVLWGFLALELVGAGLVFGDLMASSYRRNRMIAALVTGVLVAAIAVVLHVVLREAVWELDDDIGYDLVGLALGAYVIPIAAIGGLASIVTALVLRHRRAVALRS